MADERRTIVRREVRSPRAAAIAGIIYSCLMITGMILTTSITRSNLEDITREQLDSWSNSTSLVITLIPFAGIAFLWFTGVIRERMGDLEDRFLSTIFFGSGIILVVLLFMWGAVFGAVMVARTLTGAGLTDTDIYIFGFALMNEIIGNYALRISGVYMTAIGTLWTRTGVMPRWITILTFILALGFLVAANRIREARFIFPLWVFVVSLYILVQNYRRTHDQVIDPISALDDTT